MKEHISNIGLFWLSGWGDWCWSSAPSLTRFLVHLQPRSAVKTSHYHLMTVWWSGKSSPYLLFWSLLTLPLLINQLKAQIRQWFPQFSSNPRVRIKNIHCVYLWLASSWQRHWRVYRHGDSFPLKMTLSEPNWGLQTEQCRKFVLLLLTSSGDKWIFFSRSRKPAFFTNTESHCNFSKENCF